MPRVWCRPIKYLDLKMLNGSDGVMVGFSSVDQVRGNLDDLNKGPLPGDVVEVLDQAWHVVKTDAANFWHGDLDYAYDTEGLVWWRPARIM